MNLFVIKGANTLIHAAPYPVHAPVDQMLEVKNAILVEGPTTDFALWQDMAWYFMVDPARAALMQRPGADLSHSKIMVLLE